MAATRGLYIVIEGSDGAGTTTQSRLLCNWLEQEGRTPKAVQEPTGMTLGREIRQRLRGEGNSQHNRTDQILALLFAADRLDLYAKEIEPALERGEVVVSDRNVLSSLAYQGSVLAGNDWSPREARDWVWSINQFATQPDFLFFLDVPVEVSLARISARTGVEKERFEVGETLRKVREGYLASLPRFSPRVRIDGTMAVDKVFDEITLNLGGVL